MNSTMSYVIAHVSGAKRPALYRVIRTGSPLLCGAADASRFDKNVGTVKVKHGEVVVNLGDKPMYGSVYGVTVEPALSQKILKGWEQATFFVELPESDEQRVLSSLSTAAQIMNKWGVLREWFPPLVEVRNPKGRILGSYRYRPRDRDVLTLRPLVGLSKRELVKTIVHEGCHGIWNRIMTAEQRASWVTTYKQFTNVRSVSRDDIVRFVKGMRQMGSVRDYAKGSDEEDKLALGIYLDWLRRTYLLSTVDVQDLISAGANPPVPDVHLHVGRTDSPITLYSKSSAQEMFCEAGASLAVGDLSNPQIKSKLVKTLRD